MDDRPNSRARHVVREGLDEISTHAQLLGGLEGGCGPGRAVTVIASSCRLHAALISRLSRS